MAEVAARWQHIGEQQWSVPVQGADEAVFVLAPILLLLNQDPLLFRGLTERRRYFPPVFCASAYLVIAGVSTMLAQYSAFSERSPFVVDDAKFGSWFLVKIWASWLPPFPTTSCSSGCAATLIC